MHHHHLNVNNNNQYGLQQPMQPVGIIKDYPAAAGGGGQVIIRDTQHQQQPQQMLEDQQQMAASSSYDQSQQPQAQPAELMRFNHGLDTATVTADYNQMSHVNVACMSSSSPVVYGPFENFTYHHPVLQQQQQPSSDTYHSHPQ